MREIEMGWGHLTEMSHGQTLGNQARSRTSCLGGATMSVKGDCPRTPKGVGPAGFEPATSSTPRKRPTKLSYGP